MNVLMILTSVAMMPETVVNVWWICPGAEILSTRGTVTDGEMNALERVEQRPTDGGGVTSTDVLYFISV